MELDHLGVAVPRLGEALARWAPILGEPEAPPEEVVSQGVRVVFLTAGSAHVELLEPTSPESPVGRFLERRGEGLHHVAFRVPSVDAALAEIAGRGERVVDRVGRPGSRGRRVGFAHPSAFGGVLVEFVEAV
ncbi:MAG TPA: methylmalonyl-CoA epimerase [Thermoplasmata archaeon]|nr:methylmalonyl-CoA epimerase [Thermoplasmata archaeon]